MTENICKECKNPAEKDAIALCGKILTAKEVYCLDCLAKKLNISRECLNSIIQDYRDRGCPAFI